MVENSFVQFSFFFKRFNLFILLFIYSWLYWSLNSGTHTYTTCAMLPALSLVIFQIGSHAFA
jgi:hypothetical protein